MGIWGQGQFITELMLSLFGDGEFHFPPGLVSLTPGVGDGKSSELCHSNKMCISWSNTNGIRNILHNSLY